MAVGAASPDVLIFAGCDAVGGKNSRLAIKVTNKLITNENGMIHMKDTLSLAPNNSFRKATTILVREPAAKPVRAAAWPTRRDRRLAKNNTPSGATKRPLSLAIISMRFQSLRCITR